MSTAIFVLWKQTPRETAVSGCSQFSCLLALNGSGRENKHCAVLLRSTPLQAVGWLASCRFLWFRERGSKVSFLLPLYPCKQQAKQQYLCSPEHKECFWKAHQAMLALFSKKTKVSSCSLTGRSGLAAEHWAFCCFILFARGATLSTWMSPFKLCLSWRSPRFPVVFAMDLFASKRQKRGLTWSDLEILWSPKLQNTPLLPTHKAAPSSWSFLFGDPIA